LVQVLELPARQPQRPPLLPSPCCPPRRRKSWIIPIQLLSALLLVSSAEWIEAKYEAADVASLTALFFVFVLLAATQASGWCWPPLSVQTWPGLAAVSGRLHGPAQARLRPCFIHLVSPAIHCCVWMRRNQLCACWGRAVDPIPNLHPRSRPQPHPSRPHRTPA
jgi:hypothetical protein